PDLVLLDEPLASLDPLARRDLLRLLMDATIADGLTVLLSSHILSDLERVCDYLILLAGGQARLVGDIEEIVRTHKRLIGPRADAITALVITVALLVALIILGQQLYQSVARLANPACATYPTCYATVIVLRDQINIFHLVGIVLLVAPALIGVFVGAPFLAREY